MIIFLNRPQQDPMLLEEETWKFTPEWKSRYDQGVKCKTHLGHNSGEGFEGHEMLFFLKSLPREALEVQVDWKPFDPGAGTNRTRQVSMVPNSALLSKRTWGWEMESTAQEGSVRFFLPTEWRRNSNFSVHSEFNRYIEIQLPRVWQYFLSAYRDLSFLLELENS